MESRDLPSNHIILKRLKTLRAQLDGIEGSLKDWNYREAKYHLRTIMTNLREVESEFMKVPKYGATIIKQPKE